MKVYYHNDADGRCAAAIIYYRFHQVDPKQVSLIEFIEMDYNKKVDVRSIEKNEVIYIVDFSFSVETMDAVLKITNQVTWIDHHKTAFNYEYAGRVRGKRRADNSGCVLVWNYFYSCRNYIPHGVRLIEDYDLWKFEEGVATTWFHEGLKVFNTHPKAHIWKKLFDTVGTADDIIKIGVHCTNYRENFCKTYIDSYGFETEFEGYKCYALNLYKFGSNTFGDRFKQYDICLAFVFDGENWSVGLYSEKVDVSEIAVKHGGGGHKGASGFVCDELPFVVKRFACGADVGCSEKKK